MVDNFILQDKEKLSVEYDTHEKIDDEVDEYELYELEKWVSMKRIDAFVLLKKTQI